MYKYFLGTIARICNPCPQRLATNIIRAHKANLLQKKEIQVMFLFVL